MKCVQIVSISFYFLSNIIEDLVASDQAADAIFNRYKYYINFY